MSLPVVRKNGANFIEVVDSIGTHYLHIESIRYVRASYSQILICTNIGNEPITVTFLDKQRMKEVIQYLMDAISSHSVSRGDIDLIKEGMAGITHIHKDITESLSEVNTRLDKFKENIYQHIEDELSEKLSSILEEEEEEQEEEQKILKDDSETTNIKPQILAPNIHEALICEVFIVAMSSILIVIFVISVLQHH